MWHVEVTLPYKVREKEMVYAPGLILYWVINSKWLASLRTTCISKPCQENKYHAITRLP